MHSGIVIPAQAQGCSGKEVGCIGSVPGNHRYPAAGLGPAIHVFLDREVGSGKDVDARDKPGQGDFLGAMTVQGRRSSTIAISPDSSALARE
jgi:hypothetical protein